MALPILKSEDAGQWRGRVISHDDFAYRLAKRREGLGEPDVPRNAGNRRTAGKRALLKALEQIGADW